MLIFDDQFLPGEKIVRHTKVLCLQGGSALSAFRVRMLLQTIEPGVPGLEGVTTRFLHFVDTSAALDDDTQAVLRKIPHYGPKFGGGERGGESHE